MIMSTSRPIDTSMEFSVSDDVMSFLALDRSTTGPQEVDTAWAEIVADPNLTELVHGTLVYIHRNYPGASDEAIVRAQGIKEGISLVVRGLKQTQLAHEQDSQIMGV